jgi:hypothetical protein
MNSFNYNDFNQNEARPTFAGLQTTRDYCEGNERFPNSDTMMDPFERLKRMMD